MASEARRNIPVSTEALTTADIARASNQETHILELEDASSLPEQASRAATPRAGESGSIVHQAPPNSAPNDETTPLFAPEEVNDFRSCWDQIQVSFVDEPRRAVEDADRLVATTMKRLAEIFAEERQTLERQWSRGEDISTEDLRLALRRYRSFFGRLLSV